jgi:pyruvate formate lyase activating enzyme
MGEKRMKEAKLYKKLDNQKVRCDTCAHHCIIAPGKRGVCGVRENRGGKLVTLVYGKAIALHVDPIEKKPLFHFLPGVPAMSVATVGCNMHCLNCQNADISQMPKDQNQIRGEEVSPEDLVRTTVRQQCQIIAYTYTEPAVFWDYAYESAKLASEKEIKNVFVTNGFLSKESLEGIAPFLDGVNIDLKAFRDATYKSVCGARLRPVLDTIQRMHELAIWIEVTTLLIPGLNDSEAELKEIAQFIHDMDPGIPWHISRFYPTYRMTDRPPTSVESIEKAREIGIETGLRYVYPGNVPGSDGESTFCHQCGTRVIHRQGYQIIENRLEEGKCPDCGAEIDGVWV